MNTKRFLPNLSLTLSLVLVLSLLVPGCASPRPVPEPTVPPGQVTPTGEPVPAAPTPVPTPTLPPPDLPPVVVETSPGRGQEHPLDAPIVVRFDQPMDPGSTQAAFSIEPAVQGEVVVQDSELVFEPAAQLTRGEAYRITLSQEAKGQNGKLLAAPVQVPFQAVGYLEVTSTQPADGNLEVDVDTTITLVFNRPVVPLTSLDQMVDLPQPLRIDPPVAGQGQWLNTSIYAFQPEQPLAGGFTYTATVAAGLQDTTGGLLAEDYVFSFTTASPIVVGIAPEGVQVAPTTAVSVTFSQPMDRPTTEAAFGLRWEENGQPVAGSFTWLGDDRVMRFQPDQELAFNTRFVAEMTTDARSVGGKGALREGYVQRFETVPRIRITKTIPGDGDVGVVVEGNFQASFEGVVDTKTLGAGAFAIIPEPTDVFSYYSPYESLWVINWPMLPQTDYQVTLAGSIGDIFGNTVGQDTVVRFRTGNRRPFAHLNVPGEAGTYNAYTNTVVAASFRNVSRLDFSLYQLGEAEAASLLGFDRWSSLGTFRPSQESLLRQWSVDVLPEPNINVLQKVPLAEDGGPLPSGIYWVEMRAPEVRYRASYDQEGQDPARHLLIVSPLNLIVKKSSRDLLVWATDLQSGQPLANLPVRVTGGGVTADGETDSDGIFQVAISPREPWQNQVVFAGNPVAFSTASRPAPYGMASTDWRDGLYSWEYGLPEEFAPAPWQGYFYSDRPLYRPGQIMYWKGILRQDEDAIYRLPAPGTAFEVTIRDAQGELVYQENHETNAFGTIYGELPLDEEAGLGFYYLEARLLDAPQDAPYLPSFGLGFQVAEFRKPEFVVELATDRDEYLNGDTIKATVEASFFFGGPVSSAQVDWTVFSSDAVFDYDYGPAGPWYSFGDYLGWDGRETSRFGDVVATGQGKTDNQGRLVIEIPADIGDQPLSQRFSIDVRVVDLNNQEVASSAAAIVHKGLVYPGVATRSNVVQVGQTSQVDLITVDWDSQPVPNQQLTILVSKARWNTVQEKGDDGRFYWVSELQETPILTDIATTDRNGEAVYAWIPEAGGQYKISASVTDDRGNTVRSGTFVWVSDEPETYVSWRVENNDRIDLVADKPLYQVGDVAQVLIPHPYQGPVEALVSIERGSILRTRRITLQSNSETLPIPIEADYLPNIYVSVAIVKGQGTSGTDLGSYKLGYTQLQVDTAPKELTVTLTPNQPELKPGDTVTFAVQVSDSQGNPVQGEFSLSLVDKALLSLVRGQDATLLDTFYRQRGLGVHTASTLVLNLDRLNQQLREGAKGGGGGAGEAGLIVDVRSEFEDSALWEPALVTDANGQAVVSVELPDNLTTWRLDGRGVTEDTKVGQATVEIVTTLPLLARPVLPRFFVTGDQAELGVVINNNTDLGRSIRVEMVATGLSTEADTVREITVAPGDQVKVSYAVSVDPPAAEEPTGEAVIRFTAQELNPPAGNDPLGDAVQITLPVYRYSSPETVGTAGTVALGEERLEVIALPPDVDPTQGSLQVRLEPSLAAGTLESLTWLRHFPYECNEQIVSKFLPNVVTVRTLYELGISDPSLEANLREQVATAIQKLQQRQNADGGWGWWSNEDSRAFVSSYVMFGLVEAQRAGFPVDQGVIDRGATYLARQLRPTDSLSSWQLNQQAFILYVLAEAGQGDIGRTVALYDVRERLGHYGRAYLALAFGVLADQGESTAQVRINTLLDDLTGSAIVSATGAHWEEEQRDIWTMSTDTRSTSLALAALARLDPGNALAPNVVRWLMVARQAGHWETTQENAWAIIALTDWMAATGELDGDYSYRVALNDQLLAEGNVTPENVDEPVELQVDVRDMLLDYANGLAISRFSAGSQSGDGQLYYTTHLNYYLPVANLMAMDRGIVVGREYAIVDPVTGKPITERAVDDVEVGDTVQVTLTIVAPSDLTYLVLESPLPAGAEAIDPNLATTSQVYEVPTLQPSHEDTPWWWWVPSFTELRDEKVVLFATELPAGTYQFAYQMRASLPGRFQTLPVTAYEMYFPEVWGRSAGELFTIKGP